MKPNSADKQKPVPRASQIRLPQRLMSFSSLAFHCVILFVAVRSSLDVLGAYVSIGGLNPAAICGLLAFGAGILYLVLTFVRRELQSSEDRLVNFALLWMLLILVWVAVPLCREGRDGMWAVREWVRLATLATVFCVLFKASQDGHNKKILCYLTFAMVIPALFGIYQFFMHAGIEIKGVHRIYGSFAHPNPYSFHLAAMVMLCWYWAAHGRMPWLGYAGAAIHILLLLAAESFTGLVMLAGGVGVYGFFVLMENRDPESVRKAVLLGGILAAAFAGMAVYVLWDRIVYEFRPEEIAAAFETEQMKGSLSWRLVAWYKFLQAAWQHPLLGYGLDASAHLGPWPMPDGTPAEPHNDYVRMIFETGFIGTLMTGSLIVFIAIRLFKKCKNMCSLNEKRLAQTAFAVVVMAFLGAVNDNVWIATAYLTEVAALVAVALGQRDSGVEMPQ